MSGVYTILALCIGGSLGTLLRYALGGALNALAPHIPVGTLTANLVAAYIVGAAIAYFAAAPGLSPLWRLFIITGFAGGLSTFSTFAAELLSLLRNARLVWAAGMLVAHVGGSVLMAALGMATVALIRR